MNVLDIKYLKRSCQNTKFFFIKTIINSACPVTILIICQRWKDCWVTPEETEYET